MKKSSSDLSLPRRSKSIDPLGELVFQFQESSSSAKSTSALLTVVDGREGKILRFIDAPSTSSGTSDLSDYMDNLSISSYSSNEHTRTSRCPVTTLKPRSGKEYHKVGHLSLQPTKEDGSCSSQDQSSV
ncbi:uncharacterized protein LOC128989692 [Macrosteles quadrilineatus]|uniref:uncharacterized protein LOC128989692 n=1 Tax=Macrosteles quadrilineatus TaxID=74068 RepID=UPI0023E1278B|nr:uncharacterized protein LOC128989692 [Macrosteles quadrilineatus]